MRNRTGMDCVSSFKEVRKMSSYPEWVEDRFGDDIPEWAEERWGDDDNDDDEE